MKIHIPAAPAHYAHAQPAAYAAYGKILNPSLRILVKFF